MPILLFSFALLFLLAHRLFFNDLRSAFLSASILFGLLFFSITEVLSLFSQIDKNHILFSWSLIVLINLISFYCLRPVFHKYTFLETLKPRLGLGSEGWIILSILLITFILGILAILSPPNTWDSMTYHLSRVMHWIQNHNVSFYPTHIQRQLVQAPWAEYAILHLQLLSGSDHFANIVQWVAMVGSLIACSLIAKELGAARKGQIYTVIFCLTIPMGILQSTSTQTDYICTFWLLCFIYFGIRFQKQINSINILLASIALGLAILTKATAYIFALPFLIWLIYLSAGKITWKYVTIIILSSLITIAINLPHYTRNYLAFNSPLASGGLKYSNEIYSPDAITSGLIRNLSLHFGIPKITEKSIVFSHSLLGISASDSRTTWSDSQFYVPWINFHEDSSGNTLHLILLVIALFIYARNRKERQSTTTGYVASILCGAILFAIYLKWQPWHSRLHLPLFVFSAPFFGIVLSRSTSHKLANTCIITLLVTSLPWIFFNSSKKIFDSQNGVFTSTYQHRYFTNQLAIEKPYIDTVKTLSELKCYNIGLDLGGDDWEYPLWALLLERSPKENLYIKHVNVNNTSNQFMLNEPITPSPCALIKSTNTPQEVIYIDDKKYVLYQSFLNLSLYIPN